MLPRSVATSIAVVTENAGLKNDRRANCRVGKTTDWTTSRLGMTAFCLMMWFCRPCYLIFHFPVLHFHAPCLASRLITCGVHGTVKHLANVAVSACMMCVDDSVESVNKVAERVLLRLKQKLSGLEDGVQLSMAGQVNHLIQEARDVNNLCRLFPGWQAYI